jgi:cytochrome P450
MSSATDFETLDFNPYDGPRPAMYFFNLITNAARGRPVFRSSYGPGFWVITSAELIEEAHRRPDLFSSSSVIPIDPEPAVRLIPEMIDPPEHARWRKLLTPAFWPGQEPRASHARASRGVGEQDCPAGRD